MRWPALLIVIGIAGLGLVGTSEAQEREKTRVAVEQFKAGAGLEEVAAQAGEALKGLDPEHANSGSSAGVAGEPVLSLGGRGLGSGDIQIPSDRNLSS